MDFYSFKVAGVTFDGRQEKIAKLKGNEIAKAVPEPENPYDANAIAIHVAFEGEVFHVGYMPREEAAIFASRFEGEPFLGRLVAVTGGFEKRQGGTVSLGLIVAFELPNEAEVSGEEK